MTSLINEAFTEPDNRGNVRTPLWRKRTRVFVVHNLPPIFVEKEPFMEVVNIVRFDDVNGKPLVKISDLPPLKIGDPLQLRLKITRENVGRYEVLEVEGQFRVTSIGYDASVVPRRRHLSVESMGKPPTWRSIKKPPQSRPLAPAKNPRTPIA